MKHFIYLIPIYFLMIGCGNYTDAIPPFQYAGNSRIVLEGKLTDIDGNVFANQPVVLYGINGTNQKIAIQQTFSDNSGTIFVSAPKGNNGVFLEFLGKSVLGTDRHGNLRIKLSYAEFPAYGLGNLSGTYYDFGRIILKKVN